MRPWRDTLTPEQDAQVDRVLLIARDLVRAEERERCAKIAETARPQLYALPTMHLSNEEALAFAENIAQRIRSGE